MKKSEFINVIQNIGSRLRGHYSIDDWNRHIIDYIYDYLFYFPNEKENEVNFRKGLIINGDIGTGKSLLFRILSRFLRKQDSELWFNTVNCMEIENSYAKGDNILIEKYTRESFRISGGGSIKGAKHYCFDDLGMDKGTTKYYGRSVNVMSDIIIGRYNFFHDGMLSHFTTNLSKEEIKQVYGQVAFSRLNEMCEFLTLKGPDRRFFNKN